MLVVDNHEYMASGETAANTCCFLDSLATGCIQPWMMFLAGTSSLANMLLSMKFSEELGGCYSMKRRTLEGERHVM